MVTISPLENLKETELSVIVVLAFVVEDRTAVERGRYSIFMGNDRLEIGLGLELSLNRPRETF